MRAVAIIGEAIAENVSPVVFLTPFLVFVNRGAVSHHDAVLVGPRHARLQ